MQSVLATEIDSKLSQVVDFLEQRPKHKAGNKELVNGLGLWQNLEEFKDWRRAYIETGKLKKYRGRGGITGLPDSEFTAVTQVHITDDLSEDGKNLLEQIPLDGSSIGNTRLRSKLGLEEEKYRQIRQELLRSKLIQLGRGRGGSVSRSEKTVGEYAPTKGKGLVESEEELYVPLKEWLRANWGKEVEENDENAGYYYVDVTASPSGKKRDSGKWSRPDVTFVTVNSYDYLPSRYVEVTSFEIKRHVDAKDLASVYEANAHSRWANNAYLVVEMPTKDNGTDSAIEKECARLGVGLMKVYKENNKFEFNETLEPKLQTPDPNELNTFLKMLFEGNSKEKRKFQQALK